MNRGIHTRGYLLHWDFAKSVQAITFRLADSVPRSVIATWKHELASIPDDARRQTELHRRIAHYEDAGHGEALLSNEHCASILQSKFIEGHATAYKLISWVIMPNHVHVLIRLLDGASLGTVVKRWKGASAIEINRHQKRSGTLWAPDYYDRFIRDADHLYDSIAYIHRNPVKACLCAKPEDWPYSSAGLSWSADL